MVSLVRFEESHKEPEGGTQSVLRNALAVSALSAWCPRIAAGRFELSSALEIRIPNAGGFVLASVRRRFQQSCNNFSALLPNSSKDLAAGTVRPEHHRLMKPFGAPPCWSFLGVARVQGIWSQHFKEGIEPSGEPMVTLRHSQLDGCPRVSTDRGYSQSRL